MTTNEFQSILQNWIQEKGEVIINIFLPHSGGSGNLYLLKSTDQIEKLILFSVSIAKQFGDGQAIITGYHSGLYPLREFVEESFIEKIQTAWDGENWYSIVCLEDVFPEPLRFIGSGNTQEELKKDLADVMANWQHHFIGFGEHPFDSNDWAARNHVEIIELTVGASKI